MTDRICIRIPRALIKKLDKIPASTPTRSYKIRRAIKEHCEREIDIALARLLKKQ